MTPLLPARILPSPYPYFGGKRQVAAQIWDRLGNPPNYIEPFFGSGAVLLNRPHAPGLELVNDIDGFIVNFWRAVQADADRVAEYADYPAFESDLHARHAWLVSRKQSLQAQLEGDPEYYDAKIAGWWVWGMSLWIGSGFCSGKGSWMVRDGLLVKDAGQPPSGVARKLPKAVDRSLRADFVRDYEGDELSQPSAAIGRQLPRLVGGPNGVPVPSDVGIARQSPRLTAFQGVNSAAVTDTAVAGQLPYLSRPLGGVKRNRIELSSAPKGVQRKMPESVTPRGVAARRDGLIAYFRDLQARFARVRVTCGDWQRVVTPAVLGAKSPCAVLLDPPYAHDDRETGLYNADDASVYDAVWAWALANGDNPALRIAVCGYDDGQFVPKGWQVLRWKANGGYSNQGSDRRDNPHKETVWFSPHCLRPDEKPVTLPLFAGAAS